MTNLNSNILTVARKMSPPVTQKEKSQTLKMESLFHLPLSSIANTRIKITIFTSPPLSNSGYTLPIILNEYSD